MTIDFGTLIKTRRKFLKMSQAELGTAAGCHRTTIVKIEQGAPVGLDVFLAVLNALGLKVDIVEV